MKALVIALGGVAIVSLCVLVFSGVGYYTTLGKIEATCREALAFETPTRTATKLCAQHGFYKSR